MKKEIREHFSKANLRGTSVPVSLVTECGLKVLDRLSHEFGGYVSPESGTVREALADSITETLYRNGLLNEMAAPRSYYIENAVSERIQIAENWCLTYYCRMCDPENRCLNHWTNELCTHINNVKRVRIKNGSPEGAVKALRWAWIEFADLNDPSMVADCVRGKFSTEGIKDKDVIAFVSGAFAENLQNLISFTVSPEPATPDNVDNALFHVAT